MIPAFLSDILFGGDDGAAVRRIRREAERQARAADDAAALAGKTVPEDLVSIRHRMLTGLPLRPLSVWRW